MTMQYHDCSNLSHGSIHVTIMENNQRRFATQFQRALLQVADSATVHKKNQRKTIVNSWVRCLENNQLVITSAFLTVNFRK